MVYCTDINGLIEYICEVRKLDINDINVKIGLDGGGKFFKICLSLFENQNFDKPSKKVIHRTFLNTGVKRIIILAIGQVSETYNHVKTILELINIDSLDIDYTHAVDLKLANILCGLQSHSSSYPCLWCFCPKADFKSLTKSRSYPLRTFGDVREKANAYN